MSTLKNRLAQNNDLRMLLALFKQAAETRRPSLFQRVITRIWTRLPSLIQSV
jgi:hypothetical protein